MSVAMGMGYTGVYPRSSHRYRDDAATEPERTYALFMHLAALLPFVVGVPVVATLIMWLIKKDKSPYLDDHGRESLNAQLSYLIYTLGCLALAPMTCGITAVGVVVMPVLAVVFVIMAAVHAGRGEYHRYPMTLRMIH